jgi:threonine/homoserine/homoserine lactone efflux protein
MWIYLLQGMSYGFAAAVQPGPMTTYLVSEALRSGWRRTLPATLAPLLSDGPIALLMLFVLSRTPTRLLQWMSFAGGLYVLYLAYGAWKSWRSPAGETSPGGNRTILKAAMINLLNPNPYLGWSLVIGPLLFKGWRETPAYGIAVVLAFYLTMITSMAALVLLFSRTRSLGPKISRALILASALALLAFSLYLLSGAIGDGPEQVLVRQPVDAKTASKTGLISHFWGRFYELT